MKSWHSRSHRHCMQLPHLQGHTFCWSPTGTDISLSSILPCSLPTASYACADVPIHFQTTRVAVSTIQAQTLDPRQPLHFIQPFGCSRAILAIPRALRHNSGANLAWRWGLEIDLQLPCMDKDEHGRRFCDERTCAHHRSVFFDGSKFWIKNRSYQISLDPLDVGCLKHA